MVIDGKSQTRMTMDYLKIGKTAPKYFELPNIANHSELGFNDYNKGYLLGGSGFEEETIQEASKDALHFCRK